MPSYKINAYKSVNDIRFFTFSVDLLLYLYLGHQVTDLHNPITNPNPKYRKVPRYAAKLTYINNEYMIETLLYVAKQTVTSTNLPTGLNYE